MATSSSRSNHRGRCGGGYLGGREKVGEEKRPQLSHDRRKREMITVNDDDDDE